MASKTKNIGKRRFERAPVRLSAAAIVRSIDGKDSCLLMTENVSIAGLFVKPAQDGCELQIDSEVTVWLYLKPEGRADLAEHDRIEFIARVVHGSADLGYGLEIVKIPALAKDRLAAFLAKSTMTP